MIVPSGNGRFPSREALIATSLPRMARRSLRLPSSWATEINLQLRYPAGILTPKIGAASPSACPDAGAMWATTPASATTATSTKTIRLIGCLITPSASGMLFGRSLFWNDKCDRAFVEGVVVRVLQFNEHFVPTGGKTHQDDGLTTRIRPHP